MVSYRAGAGVSADRVPRAIALRNAHCETVVLCEETRCLLLALEREEAPRAKRVLQDSPRSRATSSRVCSPPYIPPTHVGRFFLSPGFFRYLVLSGRILNPLIAGRASDSIAETRPGRSPPRLGSLAACYAFDYTPSAFRPSSIECESKKCGDLHFCEIREAARFRGLKAASPSHECRNAILRRSQRANFRDTTSDGLSWSFPLPFDDDV